MFCPLISFRGHVTKFRGYVFYCRPTYIVWQSFEKIVAEMVEKVCLKKKRDVKYNGRSSITQRATIINAAEK